MDLTLTQINPHTCSLEELKNEIERLNLIKDVQHDEEQSIKIFLNSIYGGLASPWFAYSNVYAAEAITLQGQDLDKYASRMVDEYFKNMWHLDTELHKIMGITYANKLSFDTLTIIMDTDSFYFTFGEILKSCDYKGNGVDFIKTIKKYRLDKYLDEKLEEYAKRFNTKNLQVFELEKVSYSAIPVAKKKYILDYAFKATFGDEGVIYEPQSKIKYTGIEVVQASTSKFARKAIKELIKYTLQEKDKLVYSEVIKRLKDYKKDFLLQNPDDISIAESIGDYEKYVLEDKHEIKLAPKCMPNNVAAAVYNHILFNSKWRTKYNIIKTGEKVKYYYVKPQKGMPLEYAVFGFCPNNYPLEFGLSIDYDMQFYKTIIKPYNRILESMGMNQVPENMMYAKSLF